ncbi:MAG: hypothetical protein V3V00_09295 [Saprospiraceae bacterium]
MKLYGKFIASAVVFVIIGMPMLSYVYLRQGLSFRINAIESLKQDEEDLVLTKNLQSEVEFVPKMVNAVVNISKVDLTKAQQLYEKYKGNNFFHLTTYSATKLESTTNNIWGEKHFQLETSPKLQNIFSMHDMILVDTSGQVRESYQYDEETFKTFIQHLSVLLPIESSKKIKLER